MIPKAWPAICSGGSPLVGWALLFTRLLISLFCGMRQISTKNRWMISSPGFFLEKWAFYSKRVKVKNLHIHISVFNKPLMLNPWPVFMVCERTLFHTDPVTGSTCIPRGLVKRVCDRATPAPRRSSPRGRPPSPGPGNPSTDRCSSFRPVPRCRAASRR